MTFFCPVCAVKWRSGQKSIQCTSCQGWVHHNNKNNCSSLTNKEFETHCNDDNKLWECDKCISKSLVTLPFANLDDNNWLMFNDIISMPNELSGDINIVKSSNLSEFISQCDSMNNTINIEDDDENDLLSTSVNSKYYDTDQLNSLKHDLSSSFGLFHVNIASLNKHIDDLKLILSSLNYNFDIIGITEHKILKDSLPSNNIIIPGYNDFIFEPTETNCGGTGFYIKDNIDYILRKDLQINSPTHYESMFIEMVFPNKKNNCWMYL